MRFVSTGVHGLIDYLTAITLLAAPWLFGFAGYNVYATAIPVTFGAVLLVYSMFTQYELGLTRDGLTMPVHLGLDFVSGLILMVSPWALDFADEVYLPHVIIGASEMLFSLITKKTPPRRRRHEERRAGYRKPAPSTEPKEGGTGSVTETPGSSAGSAG
jgi:hypothetical protein